MFSLKTKDWKIKNIDTILFDKDGTFIDLHYFWGKMTDMRCLEIIKRYDLSENDLPELALFLGYDNQKCRMIPDGITAMYSRSKIIELFKQNLFEKYHLGISEDDLAKIFDYVSLEFYKNIQEYTKPIDSAISFIKKSYEKGLKLGVVTSDSLESTNLTLKNFSWEYLFKSVVGRESSSETKESGSLTKIALKELNSKPENTVFVGDTKMDYLAGKNAGIERTILVTTGQIDFETLKTISPYVVNSLDEVEIIKEI